MPVVTLDAPVVRHSSCPPEKSKVDLYDTAITGFILEVRRSGGKTYWLRYRDVRGKQRQHKIGDAKSLNFEQARTAALAVRARVVLGEDPVAQKKAVRQVPTVEEFAQQRYLPYVKGYKRSWDSDDSYLRNHVLPRFGKKHLDEVTQEEVIAFHHHTRAAGYAPATANRLVILMRYMYNLAKKWKIPGGEQNPAAGVALLEENNQRERYLTKEEAQRLLSVLQESDNPQLRHIVPLLLLLGCRKGELLDARWDQFDLDRRIWRIPLTKSGKARYVPLSDAVVQILAGLPRWKRCPFLLPNPRTLLPYVSVFYSWDTARKQAGMPELRMHDLRHSTASFLVNSGRSLYEVQRILGHSQLKTTQRYAHLSQVTLLEAVDSVADVAGFTDAAVAAG